MMEEAVDQTGERRRAVLLTLVMLLPLALVVFFIYTVRPSSRDGVDTRLDRASETKSIGDQPTREGRLIIVIIDSLRRQAIDQLMPNLKAFDQQRNVTDFDVHTAAGNMSLPCIQTLFEGRESPYVSGIHNFTGNRSFNNSLPAAAARAGLNTALVGDFIICSLYGPYATVSINLNTLASSDVPNIACDLCAIKKAETILADDKIRVMILHLPGTDHVAHKYKPGHPQYERHYREVDAKLAEFFALLDLKKDYLIVTGDHGHNDKGAHIPHSVAIFAGGLYPQLFAALGLRGEMQQVDMLFFMAFAQNLPLPVEYEGRYFALENPIDPSAATPELRSRLTAFGNLQKKTLSTAGFDAPNLQSEIAAQRAQARSAAAAAMKRALPLLALFIAWIAYAFYLNDTASARIWPLVAMGVPAVFLWFFASPAVAVWLAIAITLAMFNFAIKTDQLRRVWFLFLLVLVAALAAYMAELWPNSSRPLEAGLIVFGLVMAKIRGGGIYAWPAALCAVCLFALPSGVYGTQFGYNILRGFFVGCGLVCVWLIATRRLRQLKVRGWYNWMSVLALVTSVTLLLYQHSHGLGWHSPLLEWLARSHPRFLMSAFLYVGCSTYLLSIMRRADARIATAVLLLILPLYCTRFAELPFEALAVVLIVPVFLASWLIVTGTAGPLPDIDDAAHERSGLLLTAALLMAFWTLFRGFFVQEIDFTFGMKYMGETASESQLFLFLYPLTLLKYGLPLALAVFIFVAVRGARNSSQAVVAALIFCNFKLATLLVETLVGPLRSHQKIYELAMSDFVFVSQVELILAVSYLGVLAGSVVVKRLQRTSVEATVVVLQH